MIIKKFVAPAVDGLKPLPTNAVQKYHFFLVQPNIFPTFACNKAFSPVMKVNMKRLLGRAGLPLVYLGVALEVAYVAFSLDGHNWLIALSLLLIVAGIVGYVAGEKR